MRLQEQEILLDENTQEYRDLQLEKLQLYKDEEERIETDAEGTRLVNAKKAQDAKIKIAESQAAAEEKLRQQKVQGAINVVDALTGLAGAESDIGKALLLAKQAIAARELVLSIKSTIKAAEESTTKSALKASEAGVDIAAGAGKTAAAAPFPANIPLILGYAATAIGIIGSVKSALSKQKSVASQFGGGGGGGGIDSFKTPQAQAQSPSFNIVGSSGTNQLASAIGSQTQQPIQAYVVSNDITSAQSLDRNIVRIF